MKKFSNLSILNKFLIFFSFLLIILLSNYVVNSRYKKYYKNWTDLIQISQRNSSIIDNIYTSSVQLQNNKETFSVELENNMGLFQKSFLVLKYGGIANGFEDNNIKPYINSKINYLLDEIESEWVVVQDLIYDMLSEPVYINKLNTSGQEYTIINPDYKESLETIFTVKSQLIELNKELISEYQKFKNIKTDIFRFWQLILFSLSFILVFFIVLALRNYIVKPLLRINEHINALQKGDMNISILKDTNDELGQIESSLLKLSDKLKKISDYIIAIGSGELTTEIELAGKRDVLGKSLIKLQNNLKSNAIDSEKRRKEEVQQNWITTGLAKFADILKNSDKGVKELSNDIIFHLIHYVNAVQGGLYMVKDDDITGEKYFELSASYAYDRKKFHTQRIEMNEGLIGSSYFEKETIFLTDIPENYVNITSGLGGSNPKSIVIVPLKHENDVLGVIEITSLNNLQKHEIGFIEKLSENIATTILTTTISERTSKLLHKAQEQAEELQSQEEEMRQNMEEMQATQEEAHKRSLELHDIVEAINNSACTYELSPDGRFLKANNNLVKLLEIEEYLLIGSEHKNYVINNFENENAYYDFLKKLNRGLTQKHETNYISETKNIWFSETYTPIHDITENVSKILVLAYDITETKDQEFKIRKNFEELMGKEEELQLKIEELDITMKEFEDKELQHIERIEKLNDLIVDKDIEIATIIETASEGLIKVDNNGFIIAINNIAAAIADKDKNEVIGERIFDVLPQIFELARTKEVLKEKIKEFSEWTKLIIEVSGKKKTIEIKAHMQGPENIINYYLIFLKELSDVQHKSPEIEQISKEWKEKEKELIQKIQELSQEKKQLKEEKIEHLTEDFSKDFIVWLSKYNLQIAEMDEQHKRIVKLLNELKEGLDAGKPAAEILKIIKNLINYTSYHFHTEEEYFKEYKFKESAEHKKDHKYIISSLQEIEKSVSKGNLKNFTDNLTKIKDELITHFTITDIKYIDTFKMFGH